MKVVCISDTHGIHREVIDGQLHELEVPDGDLLIHAGDFTNAGSLMEFNDFNQWLGTLPHKHKVFIAGNHDFLFERYPISDIKKLTGGLNAHYLQDSLIHINGIRIYGSPWTPQFFEWAFMMERHDGSLKKKWAEIPEDLDILITHGPPQGILDETPRGEAAGCYDLLARVLEVKPRYHIFGHIHEGYGQTEQNGTTFINAALSRGWERHKKIPIVFEI